MIFVTVLWLATLAIEGMLYTGFAHRESGLRRGYALIAAVLVMVTTLIALHQDWRIWLVASVLSLYRLINTARFRAGRLPEPQLRRVSLRAHIWLVVLQAISVAVCWTVVQRSWGQGLLGVMAAMQLVVGLLLVRATLHTWRHAEPFRRVQPLADHELPTLSVLVPARNETDALETCLQGLIASDYAKLEIIVLDDNSVNRRTPEIIRSFAHDGVRFVQGAVPDEKNWVAKNQAYARLREEASGELLLFCGVDVRFGERTLRQLVEVLVYRKKTMLSVLPLRADSVQRSISLLQPMRYYWELCLPRRFFKRPPVLSTSWLIRADALDHAGGFKSVARSVTPEVHFARDAVVTDAYSFIRSNSELALYSAKPRSEQYDTSVRTRYPQLHRRLELVAVAALFELVVCVGPIVALGFAWLVQWVLAYALIEAVTVACLLVTYYFAAVATRLNGAAEAWFIMPVAFVTDIAMLHISMYKYEFARVEWKGRDVAEPVMQVIPHLPKLPE